MCIGKSVYYDKIPDPKTSFSKLQFFLKSIFPDELIYLKLNQLEDSTFQTEHVFYVGIRYQVYNFR